MRGIFFEEKTFYSYRLQHAFKILQKMKYSSGRCRVSVWQGNIRTEYAVSFGHTAFLSKGTYSQQRCSIPWKRWLFLQRRIFLWQTAVFLRHNTMPLLGSCVPARHLFPYQMQHFHFRFKEIQPCFFLSNGTRLLKGRLYPLDLIHPASSCFTVLQCFSFPLIMIFALPISISKLSILTWDTLKWATTLWNPQCSNRRAVGLESITCQPWKSQVWKWILSQLSFCSVIRFL